MPTLNWLNRPAAEQTLAHVPFCTLHLQSTHGDLLAGENMLIQGDNLDALKALLPFYQGRIKCIFIDPPYNTKSAFEHYDDNLEHSQWLSLMYPRLVLLRELLSEDGSIWVTIDDNEGHYLKVLMDEVFGRGNFVANVVWQKKFAPQNDAKLIDPDHDQVLVCAKNIAKADFKLLPRTDEMNARYKNQITIRVDLGQLVTRYVRNSVSMRSTKLQLPPVGKSRLRLEALGVSIKKKFQNSSLITVFGLVQTAKAYRESNAF